MSWAKGITKLYTKTKSTSFNENYETAYRHVDPINQVVYCQKCNFVAPMSLSFEEYLWLHERYNEAISGTCKIVFEPNSINLFSSNLINLKDKHDDKSL